MMAPLDPRKEPGSPAATVPPRAWIVLCTLLFLCILSYLDRALLSLVVEPVKHDLALSDIQLGLLQGFAFTLVFSLATLPSGWAADKFSPRLLAFAGVFVWSLATAACGLAHDFTSMFLARIGVGMGEALLSPVAFVLIGRIFPRERFGFAAGVFMIGTLMGGGLALLIGGPFVHALSENSIVDLPLIGAVKPWQAAFLLLGVPGAALSLLAFTLPNPPRERARATAADAPGLGVFLRRNGLMIGMHLLSVALLGLCAYSTLAWGVAHFSRSFGWSVGSSGPALGIVIGGVAAVGTLVNGAIADRWFARGTTDAHIRLTMWLAILGYPFCIAAFLVSSPYLFLLLLAITYIAIVSFGGTGTSVLQIIAPPALRGRMASFYTVVMGIFGGGPGPLMPPLLGKAVLGPGASIGAGVALTMAVFIPIAVLLMATNLRRYRRAVAEAERFR